jgi:hypothetical protein
MSDRDPTTHDEYERRSLGAALADLADAMPENPFRVESVHARARRLRTRRRVIRATAGVMVGAVTIAALVAVRPGASHVTTIPASQPSALPAPPSCRDALAADEAHTDEADAAKKAAADAANDAVTGFEGVKGIGIIVSATDASLTIRLEEPTPDQPSEITATFSPTAEFADGVDKVDVQPAVAAGDRVAFGASRADDGSYELIFLGVNLPELPVPTTETVDPARKAAGAVGEARYLKAMAEVTAMQPDSVTLEITDGDLRDQLLTTQIGPNASYVAGDQECVDPQLSVGQQVGVVLLHADDGGYVVQEIVLTSS